MVKRLPDPPSVAAPTLDVSAGRGPLADSGGGAATLVVAARSVDQESRGPAASASSSADRSQAFRSTGSDVVISSSACVAVVKRSR